MGVSLDSVRRLGAAGRYLAILATTRRDGTVHATLVNAGVLPHPVTGEACVGAVAQGSARKLVHLRRVRRAAFAFHAGWEWVAVEGPVDLLGPEDEMDGFSMEALPQLLRDIFTAAGGTHEDWAEYDRVMAAEGRTAILVTPARVTGTG